MKQEEYYYLIHLQYLGFRFHGWAKQPDVKTVHLMVDKTIKYMLGEVRFKTLGSSRTDAMVSAHHMALELFLKTPIDTQTFLADLNLNLPADIKALKVEEVDGSFNIIQSSKTKEYVYLFAQGEKSHPFSAPFICTILEPLDIETMKVGARLFEGLHNFRKYCTKPSPNTVFEREILVSKITSNDILTANFFPKNTYAYHIHSKGFMRHQVRLMMGQLFELGKGNINLNDLRVSIENPDDEALDSIAPASGLMLNKIDFDIGD